MSDANYTKYFLEVGGRRMYVQEPEFDYDDFVKQDIIVDPQAITDTEPRSPVRVNPNANPLFDPLHKILKSNFDQIDAAMMMKIKRRPTDVVLPEISLGVEKKRSGKVTTYIKYKLFQTQVVRLYKDKPFYQYYLFTFNHYHQLDSKTKSVVRAG